jgi:hypothetical protein
MSYSTGGNFNNTLQFLLDSTDCQLVSNIATKYKSKDLPDEITEKLTKCDIPHVVNLKKDFKIYFGCCSEHDIVLSLSVITRFPDLIEKQVYDLLLPNKSAA